MIDRADAPILTAPLFAEVDAKLIELLEPLDERDWQRPTIVPRWNVKQIAAHLLDTALRRLSFDRDRPQQATSSPPPPDDLVRFINELNARGVECYGALSPRVLVSLMRATVRELSDHFLSLDPMAPAAFGVSWAGEDSSLNWFDTAREYTERWHHQQQIRLAVHKPGIMTPRLYRPVLDCFMRGLPHAYRDVDARPGDVVAIRVDGDCGGTWCVRRTPGQWELIAPQNAAKPIATTTIPQDIAWRIFTRGVTPAAARAQITIDGDERAGAAVLSMLAIVG